MNYTVWLSKNKSERSTILTLRQLELAQPGLVTEIQIVDSRGQKHIALFRATKALYEEPLPTGGKVMVLEGNVNCVPIVSGKAAVRYYPKTKRVILVVVN